MTFEGRSHTKKEDLYQIKRKNKLDAFFKNTDSTKSKFQNLL